MARWGFAAVAARLQAKQLGNAQGACDSPQAARLLALQPKENRPVRRVATLFPYLINHEFMHGAGINVALFVMMSEVLAYVRDYVFAQAAPSFVKRRGPESSSYMDRVIMVFL